MPSPIDDLIARAKAAGIPIRVVQALPLLAQPACRIDGEIHLDSRAIGPQMRRALVTLIDLEIASRSTGTDDP